MSELLPAGNGTMRWIGRSGQSAARAAAARTALPPRSQRNNATCISSPSPFLQAMASASRKLSNNAVRSKNLRANSGSSAVRRNSS